MCTVKHSSRVNKRGQKHLNKHVINSNNNYDNETQTIFISCIGKIEKRVK